MRYLYYCNSPYQLMNILNLNWHRKYDNFECINNYESDLIIIDSYVGAKDIYMILKNSDEFSNVILANRFKNKGIFHSISSFLDIIFPMRFLRKSGSFDKKFIKNKYDYIDVPKISKIPLSIWHYNKKAKIQLFEEGMGSYYGGMHMSFEYGTHQNLYKIINGGREISQYINIYLNDKRLYIGEDKEKVVEIPKFNVDYLNDIKKRFSKLAFKETNKKIYWIGQYIKDDEINKILSNELSKKSSDVVYCPHPRLKLECENSIESLKSNKFWEISVLNIDGLENTTFISMFSTAIFSPKLLFNKEPYVIFCSKLINFKDKDHINKIQRIIDIFKTTYINQDKVIIPNSNNELIETIRNIESK